jgi:hypothetical protein
MKIIQRLDKKIRLEELKLKSNEDVQLVVNNDQVNLPVERMAQLSSLVKKPIDLR